MSTMSRIMLVVVAGSLGFAHEAAAQLPGKAIFERKGNCFTCHGANAKGTPLGPDLTDGQWLHVDGTAPAIIALIRTGVPKPKKYPAPMPPMGGARLSQAEIEALAAYIVSLNPKTSGPGTQAHGVRNVPVKRRQASSR